ncbi:MAG: Ig-like domain repeat protein, partial [Thermoguttaceae bacterium]
MLSTSVSGVIFANTIWYAANRTYNLTGSVYVEEGATLTIQPGVQVQGSALYIDDDGSGGSLSASGVSFQNSRVELDKGAAASLSGDQFLNSNAYVDATLAGSLSGNTFPANSTVSVLYGTLETSATFPFISNVSNYALSTLYIESGATLTIANQNTITGSGLYVNDNNSGGSLSASGVTFQNSRVELDKGASVSLSGDKFLSNNVYVDATLASSLSGNTFPANSTVSVLYGTLETSATFPLISNVSNYSLSTLYIESGATLTIANQNTITGSGLYVSDDGSGGILMAEGVTFSNQVSFGPASQGLIEFDKFTYSGYNYFDGQMLATVTDDDFSASEASAQGTSGPVRLQGNWWGSTNETLVRQNKILDKQKESYLPAIDLDPMLTAAPVAVIGITPTTGPSAGGTPVTITGMGLTGATAVMFGTTAASNVVINSNMQITATSPRGASGRVDVTVVTPSGSSAISSADQFIYQGVSTAPGVTPTQMRDAYGVDSITIGSLVGDGAGQTIAIIGAYDDPDLVSSTNPGFSSSDLHLFDEQMGLPDPPSFLKLDQDGGTNYPSLAPTPTGTSGSWSSEECLDVEWAHVIAPEANIVLFEANSPAASDQLGVAVNTAKNYSGVSVVSMSFGWPGGFPGDTSYDSSCFVTPSGHNGVTFVASTGDNGPPGDYAAFSPNVVAVGGTTLTLGAGGSGYGSEAAWSSSGGGQATDEPEPAYQEGVQSSGYREIPDVSMDGDRTTGVACYDSYDYGSGTPWVQTGGTSLSAPMFAGLLAIADQLRVAEGGTTLDGPSQTLPYLYQLGPSCYHDITSGNITSGNGTYNATVGYDMATGIGTPIANVLVLQLAVYGIKTVYGITTTALTSSNAFSTYGQTVTFTATVTPWSGSGPTGTIQFQIDGTSVGSPVTLSGGMAAYSTTLTPGNHTILAIYSGDSNFSGSRSATFSEVVGKATPTFTWASPGTITYGTALSNTQLDAAASWIVGGSSVPVAGTFTYGPGIGTVLSAGNNQLLSATDFVPSDTTDYNSVAYPVTTEINVNKATPTFTWATPGTITYGTALSATQLDAAASWIVGGSIVPVAGTFTYGPGIGTVLSAGNNEPLSATNFVPSDTTDYNSVANPVTTAINVNKATPTFTWATPAAITFGTALSNTQLDAAGSWIVGGSIVPVAGTFTYGPGIGTVLSAGNN